MEIKLIRNGFHIHVTHSQSLCTIAFRPDSNAQHISSLQIPHSQVPDLVAALLANLSMALLSGS